MLLLLLLLFCTLCIDGGSGVGDDTDDVESARGDRQRGGGGERCEPNNSTVVFIPIHTAIIQ
jgi:hypothetical protein